MTQRTPPNIPLVPFALVALGLLCLLLGMSLSSSNNFSSVMRANAEPFGVARAAPTPTADTTTRLFLDDNLPFAWRALIATWAADQKIELVSNSAQATLAISARASDGARLLAERVYVPVMWFPTLREDITLANLREVWQGKISTALFVSDETASALSGGLGVPAANVKRVPADELTAKLWSDPRALGIVPFDQLNVKLTALTLDGVDILARDADVSRNPLVARMWLNGDASRAQAFNDSLRAHLPTTNRDTSRVTTLVMTGVTAITRVSAYKVEQKRDPAYPARKIAPVLSRADIVHVSNEVSFVDGCVPDTSQTFTFCSKPSYLEALKLIGTKIVGLTGNHLMDFGAQNFLKTLDLYDGAGMRTYGGGRNAGDAAKPLSLTDHGNRLAFIGANPVGPRDDWATATQPGSRVYDANAIAKQIADARTRSDLVFVELQGEETYTYEPDYANLRMFRRTLTDGADVVTGVQAHQPQAIEFSAERNDKIILYGLGNLFFDQMFSEAVRQGIIVRHTIYEGRLLQTELLTTMLEDSVQPRWTTAAEREKLLRAVFNASGFKLP